MGKANVYVTRQIPEEGAALLRTRSDVAVNPHDRPLTHEELLEKVKGRDGILCLLTDKIDAEVFEAAAGAKGFANYAVGYDNIDVPEATKRGLPISNTPGVLTHATAEMAWALLFSTARRVMESDQRMRSGQWEGWGPLQFIGFDVTGRTLSATRDSRGGMAKMAAENLLAMLAGREAPNCVNPEVYKQRLENKLRLVPTLRFQMNYREAWQNMGSTFKEAACHRRDVQLFLEYKSSETRVHCFLDSAPMRGDMFKK